MNTSEIVSRLIFIFLSIFDLVGFFSVWMVHFNNEFPYLPSHTHIHTYIYVCIHLYCTYLFTVFVFDKIKKFRKIIFKCSSSLKENYGVW